VDPTAALGSDAGRGPGVVEIRQAVTDAILRFAGSKVAMFAPAPAARRWSRLQAAAPVAVL
jgi:hypothetical protein